VSLQRHPADVKASLRAARQTPSSLAAGASAVRLAGVAEPTTVPCLYCGVEIGPDDDLRLEAELLPDEPEDGEAFGCCGPRYIELTRTRIALDTLWPARHGGRRRQNNTPRNMNWKNCAMLLMD